MPRPLAVLALAVLAAGCDTRHWTAPTAPDSPRTKVVVVRPPAAAPQPDEKAPPPRPATDPRP